MLGSCVEMLSGDDGLEREREREAEGIFVCGDVDRVDSMGDGAWICMDIAKVGDTGAGTRARLMKPEGGGRCDGVELCRVRRT